MWAEKIKSLPVLPAHAGVILRGFRLQIKAVGPSRTCGGDPSLFIKLDIGIVSFPRERG